MHPGGSPNFEFESFRYKFIRLFLTFEKQAYLSGTVTASRWAKPIVQNIKNKAVNIMVK